MEEARASGIPKARIFRGGKYEMIATDSDYMTATDKGAAIFSQHLMNLILCSKNTYKQICILVFNCY